MIVSNTNFIWLGGGCIQFGRFDFVHEFKELDETGKFTSLKEDFEDIIVSQLKLGERMRIEQYGNIVFFCDIKGGLMLQHLIWEFYDLRV